MEENARAKTQHSSFQALNHPSSPLAGEANNSFTVVNIFLLTSSHWDSETSLYNKTTLWQLVAATGSFPRGRSSSRAQVARLALNSSQTSHPTLTAPILSCLPLMVTKASLQKAGG